MKEKRVEICTCIFYVHFHSSDKPLVTEEKGKCRKEIKSAEVETTKNDGGGNTPVFGGNTSSELSFAAIAAKSPPSAFSFGSKTGKMFCTVFCYSMIYSYCYLILIWLTLANVTFQHQINYFILLVPELNCSET